MASQPNDQAQEAEIQAMLERLINSRNRDLSIFIPFLLSLGGAISNSTDPDDHNANSAQTNLDPDNIFENNDNPDGQNRERIILYNTLTQGMMVIEGTGLDALFRGVGEKGGPPPASKSSIEALPSVEIGVGGDEHGECSICLDEFGSVTVKEMPCKHRFHGECIEKWLRLHGSCPVCRFTMPVEEGEERERSRGGGERRGIWVSFGFGRRRGENDEEQTEAS